ncbi:MAG: N-6 DNA methylase, partial [bacterium]|nr:N-6 DNA methylase [bacterium]
HNNIDAYKKGRYNETQARREFIDPLFTAIGWDVDNEQGYAEAYKDVVHEDAIKIGRATKAPDYSFRIGGVRKFFVEAKKPSVDIKEDTHPAYQLRRYAWSAKLPLSILTDFEEFAVYDCRVKPEKTDKASKARVLYLTYTDYERRWEELSIFSREAILKGSFDKYADSHKAKRGTAEVDVAFLQEIERWRDVLARNIALRNPQLSRRELNFAVQRTIDRIIFLRICEDRGIEEYGKLMALQNGVQLYARMLTLFYQADERYNSGIFHFKTERDSPESPDRLTPELTIDDTVLKDILKNIYYPDSPYEFSVLSSDILGQVYEQFLGKVIRLTAGHQAKVEEKPEVKKAGGVYYTPTYIVEYIVTHTVGELLTTSTPNKAEKLRILDPACGSGSFLLGAYQCLLDWHRDYYLAHTPQKWTKGKAPRLYQNDRDEWKLTIDERKRILLNNVYGVDIDSQAVEVTKLSLLLKVLEGEDEQTISSQMALFQKRVLPDLSHNIKCGNSLIGSDFYDGKQLTLLDEEEMYRINSFDWESEFSEIMQCGGFNTVIGNPPYVRSQFLDSESKDYLSKSYSAPAYQPDTFAFFLQKGIDLLEHQGVLGYIIPNGILTNTYYARLRRYILDKTAVKVIVDLKDGVFATASVDTSIFILCREYDVNLLKGNRVKIGEHLAKIHKDVLTPSNSVEQSVFLKTSDYTFNTKMDAISFDVAQKITLGSIEIREFFEVKAGMKVRKNFVANEQSDARYKPFLLGGNIKPYSLKWSRKWVCYDKQLEKKFTNQAFRDESIFLSSPKLLIRQIMGQERIYATIDSEKYYADQTLYILQPKKNKYSLFYILGLLCSKVMTFYFSKTLADGKQTFPKIKGAQIKQLPIHIIDFVELSEKFQHDKIVEFVEQMLDLHRQLQDAKMPQAQTMLTRQIEATDRQIDRLVYELYGLTEEEIEIVEKG